MKKIAIFISGRGSNLEAILEKRKNGLLPCEIAFVFSNKPDAKGLEIAKSFDIPTFVYHRKEFSSQSEFDEKILSLLRENSVEIVVLAGFMMILSHLFIENFTGKIINIHPSLLPAFPGLNSQRRALDYGVKFAGCTVHFVTKEVDSGPIILQDIIPVFDDDSEETLMLRILEREHIILPEALKILLEDRYEIFGRRVVINK
jgi:phosphoribosylglycinamide formyltransferase 1